MAVAVVGGGARRSRPGLSREAFDLLMATLDPTRERAGQKYEAIRARLLRFFIYQGAPRPEDLADETIDLVSRRLSDGEVIRVADVSRYFLGVARNVARQAWDLEQRRRETAFPVEAAALAAEEAGQEDPVLACLESCLEQLPPESRDLVLRYYDNEPGGKIDRRRDLARQLGIRANALRIRLHRLRAQLEVCVRRCLQERGEAVSPAKPRPSRGPRS